VLELVLGLDSRLKIGLGLGVGWVRLCQVMLGLVVVSG
jgi:hypothetical protein